jgi:hypothetical protein
MRCFMFYVHDHEQTMEITINAEHVADALKLLAESYRGELEYADKIEIFED